MGGSLCVVGDDGGPRRGLSFITGGRGSAAGVGA